MEPLSVSVPAFAPVAFSLHHNFSLALPLAYRPQNLWKWNEPWWNARGVLDQELFFLRGDAEPSSVERGRRYTSEGEHQVFLTSDL
jgi:hypothetical protein